MKKQIILLLIILVFSTPVLGNETLQLSSLKGPIAEINGRILSEAYQSIGLKTILKVMPAERAILQANSGRTSGEVGRIRGLENKYSNLIMVPTSINQIEVMVFTKKINIFEINMDSLKHYTIAIRTGEKITEGLTNGLNVTQFITTEKLFELVSNDRYDFCITNRINGLMAINSLNLKDIKILEPPLKIEYLYHYLHKKHKDIVPKINNALLKMKNNGRVEEIKEEYYMQKNNKN